MRVAVDDFPHVFLWNMLGLPYGVTSLLRATRILNNMVCLHVFQVDCALTVFYSTNYWVLLSLGTPSAPWIWKQCRLKGWPASVMIYLERQLCLGQSSMESDHRVQGDIVCPTVWPCYQDTTMTQATRGPLASLSPVGGSHLSSLAHWHFLLGGHLISICQ